MIGAQTKTTNYRELYIDGRWQPQFGRGSIDVLSASTEEIIGSIPEGTPEDIDKAVRAARTAFDDGWSRTTVAERAEWLRKLSGALKDRVEAIARTIAQEVGSPITMATNIQAGLPVMVTGTYAQMITEIKLEQELGNSLVIREPY